MDKPVTVCGKKFSAELIAHLNEVLKDDPHQRRSALARVVCTSLNWFSTDGRPALSSARVAMRKLEKRGLLFAPGQSQGKKRNHRLRASGQCLPRLRGVPRTVMIQQHPCGFFYTFGDVLIGSDGSVALL